jgi:hypothetical protein
LISTQKRTSPVGGLKVHVEEMPVMVLGGGVGVAVGVGVGVLVGVGVAVGVGVGVDVPVGVTVMVPVSVGVGVSVGVSVGVGVEVGVGVGVQSSGVTATPTCRAAYFPGGHFVVLEPSSGATQVSDHT